MKKYISILALLAVLLPSVAFGAGSVTPTSGTDGVTVATLSAPQNAYSWWDTDGSFLGSSFSSGTINFPTTVGTYHVTFYTYTGLDHPIYCGALSQSGNTSYSNCTNDGTNSFSTAGNGIDVTYTISPPPPPPVNGITDMITFADSGFSSSTGFSVSDITSWSATNLLMLFLGSGLALLFNLRYWIVAFVIISSIVYFAYRAFRFFKH